MVVVFFKRLDDRVLTAVVVLVLVGSFDDGVGDNGVKRVIDKESTVVAATADAAEILEIVVGIVVAVVVVVVGFLLGMIAFDDDIFVGVFCQLSKLPISKFDSLSKV
jgi:hypothetical protein